MTMAVSILMKDAWLSSSWHGKLNGAGGSGSDGSLGDFWQAT